MKSVLVVMLLAGAAHADTLFASDHDGTLVVSKLAGDKVTTVYEELKSGALEYAWSDAHTLWVLRAKGGFTIGKIVDGVAAKPRLLAQGDWKPTTDKMPKNRAPHLLIVEGGQVWLERCVDFVQEEFGPNCDHVYLRVDAPDWKASLGHETFTATEWNVSPKAIAAAPTGYTLEAKSPGFVCQGPKKKLVFKAGTRMISGIEWVSAEPAIAHFGVYRADDGDLEAFTAPATELVDPYVHPMRQTEGTGLFFLEDCTTYLESVIAIEPGAIATTEGDHAWKLRRGAKVLATFTANRVVALPL